MFVFMVIGDREESARNARLELIIVGVNRSAAAEAAAQWAVREAELRNDDVLLVRTPPWVRVRAKAESFHVRDVDDPLLDGEIDRTRALGRQLAASIPRAGI
jgi:hypothetical protein